MSVVMSAQKATALDLQPLLRLVSFAVGGVDPGVMGIGPVVAIPKALRLAGLDLGDIAVIELNEAFASQAVYVMRRLGLDPERTNPNRGHRPRPPHGLHGRQTDRHHGQRATPAGRPLRHGHHVHRWGPGRGCRV